jgi:hypothetical protein
MLMQPAPRPAPECGPVKRVPVAVAAVSAAESTVVPASEARAVPGGTSAHPAAAPVRGEPSAWMVVPVAVGVLLLLLLGVHPPAELTELFARAVALLSGRPS